MIAPKDNSLFWSEVLGAKNPILGMLPATDFELAARLGQTREEVMRIAATLQGVAAIPHGSFVLFSFR